MSEPATHPAHSANPATNGQGGAAATRYLCPYCGQVTADSRRCASCAGHLDPLSRQATQNTMGPWQIHDPGHPFRPGCSFATVRKLIERGQITRRTILRGPTTRQFWTFADRTPSVANLLGVCHNCHAEVSAEAFLCAACGASFTPETDRQYLGLAPRRPLPGEAPADQVAHLASDGAGMPDAPRRDGPERPDGEQRVQRPAFPADPRPPRQKRSPVAVIAVVAVSGIIGLSLGAAGALAVAAELGLIDLTDRVPPPSRAGEAQTPPEEGQRIRGSEDQRALVGPSGAGMGEAQSEEQRIRGSEDQRAFVDPSGMGEARPPEDEGVPPATDAEGRDGGAGSGAEGSEAESPVAEDPSGQDPREPEGAPAVPPRLRRLP